MMGKEIRMKRWNNGKRKTIKEMTSGRKTIRRGK